MLRAYKRLMLGLFLCSLSLSGCGYNELQGLDEETNAAWSEVLNQYQRRADLIPNLVATVKGYAAHEKDTLESVTQARSQVAGLTLTPEALKDPTLFQKFQEAQQGLTSALSRLMVVVERYPDLKANENFRDLQSQLEGTENRITVARKRYIDKVVEYQQSGAILPHQSNGQISPGAGRETEFYRRPMKKPSPPPPEVKF